MSNTKVQYEIQELVGTVTKRWKAVTYPADENQTRESYERFKSSQEGKFRLVKVEIKRTIIEV